MDFIKGMLNASKMDSSDPIIIENVFQAYKKKEEKKEDSKWLGRLCLLENQPVVRLRAKSLTHDFGAILFLCDTGASFNVINQRKSLCIKPRGCFWHITSMSWRSNFAADNQQWCGLQW